MNQFVVICKVIKLASLLANSSEFKSLLLSQELTCEQSRFSAKLESNSVESVKPASLKPSERFQIYFVLYLSSFVFHLRSHRHLVARCCFTLGRLA